MDELCRRNGNVINACLSSNCCLLNFVARQGIFGSQMTSPLERNAHFCCKLGRYGDRTRDISLLSSSAINCALPIASQVKYYESNHGCVFFLREGLFSLSSVSQSLEDCNRLIIFASVNFIFLNVVATFFFLIILCFAALPSVRNK